MKLKRKVFVLLFFSMVLACLCGCGGNTYIEKGAEDKTAIAVQVKVQNGSETYIDTSVTLQMQTPDLFTAVSVAMKQSGKSFSSVGGVFDAFDGVRATDSHAWVGYVNEKKIETYKGMKVAEGDIIKFVYEEIKK